MILSFLLGSVLVFTWLWGRKLGICLLWRLAPKHYKVARREESSGDSLGSEMDDYNNYNK